MLEYNVRFYICEKTFRALADDPLFPDHPTFGELRQALARHNKKERDECNGIASSEKTMND